MPNDRPVRYFDFSKELVAELSNPQVREAYEKWRAVVDEQNVLPPFAEDEIDTTLYEAFIATAQAHGAVSTLN